MTEKKEMPEILWVNESPDSVGHLKFYTGIDYPNKPETKHVYYKYVLVKE